MLTYEEAKTYLDSLGDMQELIGFDYGDQELVMTKAQELMNRAALDMPNDEVNQKSKNIVELSDHIQNTELNPMALKAKSFNLKKTASKKQAQFDSADMFGADLSQEGLGMEQSYNDAEQMQQETDPFSEGSQFNSHVELKQALDQYEDLRSFQEYQTDVARAVSDDTNATDALDRYYQESNDEIKAELAEIIYKGLPANMQNQQVDWSDSDGMTVPVKPIERSSMQKYLDDITKNIRSLAKEAASKKKTANKKTFNLKTAQHHTDQNVIMYGPGQTRIDPFYRQPVSDWHILERNKGWGGDIDGVWNVDWEAVWRGNVMDKYSRPYRDTETGEWVGGYIQKRFEVDKNIPEANNMQLLPGERRKPIMPEYGNTESRLQAMRHKNDGQLGREFNDTSEPFNWREAKNKNQIKTAQVQRPRKTEHLMGPDPEAEMAVFDAEMSYEELSPEEKARIDAEINESLDEMYEERPEMDNMSRKQVADDVYDRFEDIEDYSDPAIRDRYRARQMTDMMMPVASNLAFIKKYAQSFMDMKGLTINPDVANKASIALSNLMQSDMTLEFVNAFNSNKFSMIDQMIGNVNFDDDAEKQEAINVLYMILSNKSNPANQQKVRDDLQSPGLAVASVKKKVK